MIKSVIVFLSFMAIAVNAATGAETAMGEHNYRETDRATDITRMLGDLAELEDGLKELIRTVKSAQPDWDCLPIDTALAEAGSFRDSGKPAEATEAYARVLLLSQQTPRPDLALMQQAQKLFQAYSLSNRTGPSLCDIRIVTPVFAAAGLDNDDDRLEQSLVEEKHNNSALDVEAIKEMHAMAIRYRKEGQTELADAFYNSILRSCQQVLGYDSPSLFAAILVYQGFLSSVSYRTSSPQAVEARLRIISGESQAYSNDNDLSRAIKKLKNGHPSFDSSLLETAQAQAVRFRREQKWDLAAAHYKKLIELAEKCPVQSYYLQALCTGCYYSFLYQCGREEEANKLLPRLTDLNHQKLLEEQAVRAGAESRRGADRGKLERALSRLESSGVVVGRNMENCPMCCASDMTVLIEQYLKTRKAIGYVLYQAPLGVSDDKLWLFCGPVVTGKTLTASFMDNDNLAEAMSVSDLVLGALADEGLVTEREPAHIQSITLAGSWSRLTEE